MSHIPIDLVRRDRVMSVCVLRYFVTPITHEPLIGHMFERLHFFMPRPEQELFHELVNRRHGIRLFNKDLSIFFKNVELHLAYQNHIFCHVSIPNFTS